MKTITKENTKYIKNFYGITVEEIEKEVNDWCAEENAIIDQAHSIIGNMELPNTTIGASIRPTTGTSPDGTQTSFSTTSASNAKTIPLNDNYSFDVPYMVCSEINETNELSGTKSLIVPITLVFM